MLIDLLLNISICMLLNILNAQHAFLWYEHTTRDVCATHPLHHRWHFVPSHAKPLSDAASVHRRHGPDECRKCMSVHASIPKEDILVAFNMTQEYINNDFFSTTGQNSDIVLNMSEFCYFFICFSQGSVATLAGVVGNMTWASESNSERILKIGQRLLKLWTNITWHVFMAHGAY